MSELTNPYGVSFIQTAAGAVITGEIKRYETYQQMYNDTTIAAAVLATVANASHDEDFDVPEDHVGGVLYQRDTISRTWILLYTEKDLAVPTYVNWDHILDIPPWVGGITHNRKKLVENTIAELRTTYYSFGRYNLIIPRADLMKTVRRNGTDVQVNAIDLGEEIVLEQYETPIETVVDPVTGEISEIKPNVGAMLIPYQEGDILTETAEVMTIRGEQFQVIFTYAPVSVRSDGTDNRITTHAYSFKLTCTEDDNGTRYWILNTTDDHSTEAIRELREEQANHLLASDPHNQYVKKIDLNRYFVTATALNDGVVSLAVLSDVDAYNNTKAVTPAVLKDYVTSTVDYRFNVLNEAINVHVNNQDIHVTQRILDAVNRLDNHVADRDMHITPQERARWNRNGSGSGTGGVDSGALQDHIDDPYAHEALFNRKLDNTHNTDPAAHTDLFALKQDALDPSGQWITINKNNATGKYTVNCTLKAGQGVNIDPTTGTITCTINSVVGEATTTKAGVVKIVEEITDNNKNNVKDAVTPKALTDLLSGLNIPLTGMIDSLPDIDANIRNRNANTSTTKINLKHSKMTSGCLLLPFTYTYDNVEYNLALEWGMSYPYGQELKSNPSNTTVFSHDPVTIETNTWAYLMINKLGYYRIKKILFANTRCYHGTYVADKLVWAKYGEEAGNIDLRLISPLSFRSASSSLGYQDGISCLMVLFDAFNNKSNQNSVMAYWTILGLVDKNEIWTRESAFNLYSDGTELLTTGKLTKQNIRDNLEIPTVYTSTTSVSDDPDMSIHQNKKGWWNILLTK